MNAPGLSIFQGAESIKIDNTLDRVEEAEDLEDQKRRNEELQNMFAYAFDDLDNADEDTTADSTGNFRNDFVQKSAVPNMQQNANAPALAVVSAKHDAARCEAEMHHLKMMLESRTREYERSQKLLTNEYQQLDELKKKLSITEAELDRALSSKKNTHELLVESKEKCSNLENTISKMLTERKAIESENNILIGKLETSQTLLSDLQHKYDMVQRDLNRNNERNAELKQKRMEERHRAEMAILQQRMEQVADKLDKKTIELEKMNTRYEALQNSHDAMLCDKASKINDLSQALDQVQKRCEELSGRTDYQQENLRLQKLVASLQDQTTIMGKTIRNLTERLDHTTTNLDALGSLLEQHNMEDTSSHRLSQTQGHIVGSTPFSSSEGINHFKEGLQRALANLKNKRQELQTLQQLLQDKDAQMKLMRQEENKNLVQINTLKENEIRLENRLKLLQEELEAGKKLKHCQEDNHVESLKHELQNLKIQYAEAKEQKIHLEKQKDEEECERKRLSDLLKNMEVDVEELKQEHASLKQNYEQLMKENKTLKQNDLMENMRLELEKYKFLLKDSQAECDRLKNLYIEISNVKESLSFEMEKLLKSDPAKDLQSEKEKCTNLQRALQLAEIKAAELMKMLEMEKLSHQQDLTALKDKLQREYSEESNKSKKDKSNECSKCLDYLAQLTKLEIQNLKLENINSVSRTEIDELTKELKNSKAHLNELNEQLKVSEEQEILIKELKAKARQFEEYVKSHSNSSNSNGNSPSSAFRRSPQCDNKSVNTSPELSRHDIRKIETRIRDEMAKIFAIELKKLQVKMHSGEEQNVKLQKAYQGLHGQLQQRQKDVDILKQAILAEREAMEEILTERKQDYEGQIQKKNSNLELQSRKINELSKELQERQTQIEAERQSMKAVMKQWEEQRRVVDDVEREYKEKLKVLEELHETALNALQTKYKSAKKTANNYKRYAEDKEAHMLKEYDRLKQEYRNKLKEIEQTYLQNLEVDKPQVKATTGKPKNPQQQQQQQPQPLGINNKENVSSLFIG